MTKKLTMPAYRSASTSHRATARTIVAVLIAVCGLTTRAVGQTVLGNDMGYADWANMNTMVAYGFDSDVEFTALSMKINVADAVGNISMAIYDDNGAGAPGTLLATTASVPATTGWMSIPLSEPVEIWVNDIYWLCYNTNSDDCWITFDDAAENGLMRDRTYSNGWPATFGTATAWDGGGCPQILATSAGGLSAGDGTITIIDQNGFTKGPAVTCNFSAPWTIGSMIYGFSNTGTAWDDPVGSANIDISGRPEGTVRIWARYAEDDMGGRAHPWVYDETIYDRTDPGSSVATSGTFGTGNVWPGNITGTASDARSGVQSVRITIRRNDNQYWQGSSWGATVTWLTVSGTTSWTYALTASNLTNGSSYTVQSRATDRAGNDQTTLGSDTFSYTITPPPTGSITISRYAKTVQITATLSATNATQMRVALSSDTGAAPWETYSTAKSLNLGTEGTKIVMAQFRNAAGTSSWVRDTIVYDQTPPSSVVNIPQSTYNSISWPGTVSGTASDALSGLDSVQVSIQRPTSPQYWSGSAWGTVQWVKASGTGSWQIALPASGLSNGIAYTVQSRAFDKAGNMQTTSNTKTFVYDASAVTGTISVSDYTRSSQVTATLSSSNATQMRVALWTDTATAVWEAFAASKSISLGTEGRKTVMARFRNGAGTISSWARDSIIYDQTSPLGQINVMQAAYTSATWPGTIAGTASDALSGVDSVQITFMDHKARYWQRTGWGTTLTWIKVSGATTWNYAFPVTNFGAAAGSEYTVQCRAYDKAGNLQGTPGSRIFRFDNAQALVVTIAPSETTVVAGGAATFRAAVTGSGSTLAWFKVGASPTDTLSKTGALTIGNAQAQDSGSRYFCVAVNALGSDTSAPSSLHVVRPIRAKFGQDGFGGADSARITFFDSSSGSIAEWRWSFGDGEEITYTTRQPTVAHTYRISGFYICKLVVVGQGSAGRDSAVSQVIQVYARTDNPLLLRGRVISATRVELIIDSVRKVPTGPLPPPFADSIGVWFSRSGLPVDPGEPPRVKLLTSSIQGGASYTTVVTVPKPTTPADTVYAFWASPIWSSTGKPSAYSLLNVCTVRMTPVNELTVSGAYLGNKMPLPNIDPDTARLDSAVITISNIGTIDTMVVAKIGMWYEFVGSPGVTGRDTVLPRTFASSAARIYEWRVSDPLFLNDTQRVAVSVFLIGKNGLVSSPARGVFLSGWPLPSNPCSLSVVQGETKASRIVLQWTPAGAVDDVRILYGTTPIPLGRPSASDYSVLKPQNVAQNTLEIGGLEEKTRYYFAIQIYSNRQWSDITLKSRTDDSTRAVDSSDIVVNTLRLDSLWFDAYGNSFRVRWTMQLPPGSDLDVGVTFSTDSLAANSRPPQAGAGIVVSGVTSISGEAVVDPGSGLRFNTLYHVALWLRSSNGPWSTPTDSSRGSVRTPSFSWQAVKYFNPQRISDTVTAFNGKVLLRKDSTYTFIVPVEDTVDAFRLSVVPDGFVAVSVGFSLREYQDRYPAFFIGIQYDSIPRGYGVGDLGIFRDSSGVLLALHDFSIDIRSRIVWVKTSDFHAENGAPVPFIVLVDVQKPVISVYSDTARAVPAFTDLVDTIGVVDNVRNVKWSLWYAADGGAFGPTPSVSGEVCATCATGNVIRTVIPGISVSDETGVRALLIISDGAHRDTLNLSRQVVREISDEVTTEAMEWVPLSATAHLEKPSLQEALAVLAKPGSEWQYDIERFRLVTWSTAGNAGTVPGYWVEYSETLSDLFDFAPSRIVWIKTREPVLIGLGRGTTVSLKKIFEIGIAPQAWSDFSLPFRFDMNIGEVLKATGPGGEVLEFYAWTRRDDKNSASRYVSTPLYVKGVPGLNDSLATLPHMAPTGYTAGFSVYNPGQSEIALRVPPVSSAMTRAGSLKRAAQGLSGGGWSVRVLSQVSSGNALGPVYCGFLPGRGEVSYHPRSPSFSRVGVGVRDPLTSRTYGHAVAHRMNGGGVVYDLVFMNESGTAEAVIYRLETVGEMPQGWEAWVFDPARGWHSASPDALTVTLAGNDQQDRILAVGTSEFLKQTASRFAAAKLALIGCYPNPMRGAMRIRFSLPVTGIGEVRFAVYDMRGRVMWGASRRDARGPGARVVLWDGRTESGSMIPSGVYTLRMSAFDRRGRLVGTFRRQVTCLP